jgi:ATPase subunit of ABC transporter with duplicated ATPase domains
MTVLLQASDLLHTAGERTLFEHLEMTVHAGDRLALVGHNGSGKTTLLDLLSGEIAAEAGEVRRRRGLRLARVEQFLPEGLARHSLVEAVAACGPAEQHWRAEVLLGEFGFAEAACGQAVGTLSGGEQNRLMFARALMSDPELLLLDEPTNHLDLATLVVFEEILNGYAGAFVLVSHDRTFLDVVTRQTVFLRDGRLYRFAMPYSEARQTLDHMDQASAGARRAEEAQIDRVRDSARRLAEWGRAYDSEKFARRARSMEKRVARMEAQKTFVSDGSPLTLALELGDTRARQIVAIEDLDVAVAGQQVAGRRLFSIDELVVRPGERVALLGHNGVGKSTFIRALVNAAGGDDQHIRFSPQTVLGYYDQELDEVSGSESIMDFAVRRTELGEQNIRNALVHAGFPYRVHGNVVGNLSGGERARLLFLVLSLNAPNFLIMDEPTNHIDIDGKEELEAQLLAGDATLLITSHDRRFLTTIANRYLWIRDGVVTEITDPMEFFRSTPQPSAPKPGHGTERASHGASAAPGESDDRASRDDAILVRIVELEALLEADLARKARHQKPDLQAGWRRELALLYEQLE